MLPLMGLGLGLNFANSLFGTFQLLRGLSQANKNQRPQYNIPKEIQQNLNQANLFAQQGLPQDVYNRSAGAIDRNAAFGLRESANRRGGLQNIGALNQTANDAYANLGAADAQARMNNLAQLYNSRNTMAEYRDKAFNINEMQPYQQKAQAAQAMQGAGLQNIMSGLQGAGNSLSAQQYYNALNPTGGGGGMSGIQQAQMLAQNGFQGGGGSISDNMYNNSLFSQQPSPYQQQPSPFSMLLNNFDNGYFNGMGNPNFVQQPQFNFKY